MLAGGEALNGLLLIGWSASYTYISMERFWRNGADIDVDQCPSDPSGKDRAAPSRTGGVERVGRC